MNKFCSESDPVTCAEILNADLEKINHWAYQWKMSFNPDPSKQAVEVVFSTKSEKILHPPLTFNNSLVCAASSQKHLGLILDSKLNFHEHLRQQVIKANKGIASIKRLSSSFPRATLLNVHKASVYGLSLCSL